MENHLNPTGAIYGKIEQSFGLIHSKQFQSNQKNQTTSKQNQDIQETLYTSQKSSTTSSHAPAHIGIRRSPLSPNCLIWSLLHSNSNSSFPIKARTRSAPSIPLIRFPGSSLTPSNRPDTRRTPSTFIWPRFSSLSLQRLVFKEPSIPLLPSLLFRFLFLSLCHFMTVRESLVEPIKL